MVAVSFENEVLQELERVLESPGLRDSVALKALLRHVVEKKLAGCENGLKEYALGLEVFHRSPDYDPRNDAIVRVQASSLRKKLAAYYENEGRAAALRIDLPRGGYVPRFLPGPTLCAARPPEPAPAKAKARFAWPAFALGVAAASLAFLGAIQWSRIGITSAPPGQAVWGTMPMAKRPIIVGMGMPLFYTGGDGVYLRDTHRNRPSAGSGDVLLQVERALGLRFRPHDDVYTGVGEALGAAKISRWLDRYGSAVEIANSRDLGPSDIAQKDLVVVSSMRFQTLLHEMDLPESFGFDETGSGQLRNLWPLPGEQEVYGTTDGAAGVSVTHALLSVFPGAARATRIIHVGGIHSWGTYGAVLFIVDEGHLRSLDERLARDPDNGPRGQRSGSFQVLLRIEGKNDKVRAVEYVTHKYLPEKRRK